MTTKKRAASRAPRQRRSPDWGGFTIGPNGIKWFIGVIGGLFVAYAGWKVVWDDIRTYWRLEAIQTQKDKEYERDKKDMEAKLHGFALKADRGRNWVVWSVSDSKAFNAEQFAEICRALKRPDDTCKQLDRLASRQRQEEIEAKKKASDTQSTDDGQDKK